MPSSARPFLLPVNESSGSSIGSNGTGRFSVNSGSSGPSSLSSNNTLSGPNSIDSILSGPNSIGSNSSAESSQSTIGMSVMHAPAARNNVCEPEQPNHAPLRNRMQRMEVLTESTECRPCPEIQRESREQFREENPQNSGWVTVLVSVFLIGAFLFFPAARRVFA